MLKSIFHHASFAQVGEDKSVFITAGMLSYYWIQLEFTLPVYLICIGLKSQHHLEKTYDPHKLKNKGLVIN